MSSPLCSACGQATWSPPTTAGTCGSGASTTANPPWSRSAGSTLLLRPVVWSPDDGSEDHRPAQRVRARLRFKGEDVVDITDSRRPRELHPSRTTSPSQPEADDRRRGSRRSSHREPVSPRGPRPATPLPWPPAAPRRRQLARELLDSLNERHQVCSGPAGHGQDLPRRRSCSRPAGSHRTSRRWCSSTRPTPTRTSSRASGRLRRRRLRAAAHGRARPAQANRRRGARDPGQAARARHRRDQPRQHRQGLRRAVLPAGVPRRRDRAALQRRQGAVQPAGQPVHHRHDEHRRPLHRPARRGDAPAFRVPAAWTPASRRSRASCAAGARPTTLPAALADLRDRINAEMLRPRARSGTALRPVVLHADVVADPAALRAAVAPRAAADAASSTTTPGRRASGYRFDAGAPSWTCPDRAAGRRWRAGADLGRCPKGRSSRGST